MKTRTLPSRRAFLKTCGATAAAITGPWLVPSRRAARASGAERGKLFFAYSLGAAERLAKNHGRASDEQLQQLGRITKVKGLLVDPVARDCILVGERDPSLPALRLDDLVVMLRSVFLHHDGEAPGVTINPNKEDMRHGLQQVRYFGHVDRTRVGRVCFDADYLMKKIGLSLTPSRVDGVRTYFKLSCDEAARSGRKRTEVLSRFWYYPVVSRVVTLGNGVLLDRCELAVLCEVLAGSVDGRSIENTSDFYHEPSEQFAESFSEHFDELADVWPSIRELRSLSTLAALARGLGRTETPPNLDYWLSEYRVPLVDTPTEIPVVSNASPLHGFEAYGGVVLEALSVRLKQRDVTAFAEGVLQARRPRDALVWSLYLTPEMDLVVPPASGQLEAAQAYVRGHHLFRARKYDQAIACWLEVARTYPEMGEAYYHVGRAFERKRMLACAAHYYTKAMEVDPHVQNLRLWNRSEAAVP